METKLSSIKKFYDKYAKRYNEKRILKGGTLFNEFIEIPATKSLLRGHRFKGKELLDIGCGVGAYSRFYSQLGANVTALDISPEMIKIAKVNCAKSKNIEFIVSSFEKMNFDKKYDFIIGGFMLSYFFDLTKSLNKIHHVLNQNGIAILSMLHPVKLSMISKSTNGFCIDNYFDEKDYRTDLSFEEDEIDIRKWSLEDISKAVKENNLFIDEILEPRPDIPIGFNNEDFSLYHKCPAVIVFKLKQRKSL